MGNGRREGGKDEKRMEAISRIPRTQKRLGYAKAISLSLEKEAT